MSQHKHGLKKIEAHEHKATADEPKYTMYPPSFSVAGMQMPEIKNWEVGKRYVLVIEVEQKSKSKDEKEIRGTFDIVAYKHLKEKTPEEMDDKEFEEYQGEMLSKH